MKAGSLVAAAAGALLLALLGPATSPLASARLALLGAVLGGAAHVDLRERRIPNTIVLAPLPLFAALDLTGGSAAALTPGLLAAAAALTLSLLRPAALGMGDSKLILLLALALEQKTPAALLAASVSAACYGLALARISKQELRSLTLPLAPFLALGSTLALIT